MFLIKLKIYIFLKVSLEKRDYLILFIARLWQFFIFKMLYTGLSLYGVFPMMNNGDNGYDCENDDDEADVENDEEVDENDDDDDDENGDENENDDEDDENDDDDDDSAERDLANWCIRMTQLGRHLKTPH